MFAQICTRHLQLKALWHWICCTNFCIPAFTVVFFFCFRVKQLNLNFEPVRPHTLAHTCTPLSRPRNRRVSKINLATPACHTCTAHHAPRTTQWHTFVAHSHACRQHAAANAAAARAQGAMPLSHVELICYKILFAQSKFDFCCMCNLSCHYTHSQAPYNPHTLSVMRLFFAFLSFWFREFCEFCEFFIFTLVVVVHFSWYFLSHFRRISGFFGFRIGNLTSLMLRVK